MSNFDLDDELKFIYAIKNVSFDGDNEKIRIVIKGKNSEDNILKQMADVYLKDIKEKIGSLN